MTRGNNDQVTKTEHLLTCLGEECAEVLQRVSKALRFGLAEIQTGQSLTNAERLTYELCDLLSVAKLLIDSDLIPATDAELIGSKRKKLEAYIRYAEQCGTLKEAVNEESRSA